MHTLMLKSEGNLWESVFSFHYVGLDAWTQVYLYMALSTELSHWLWHYILLLAFGITNVFCFQNYSRCEVALF